MLAGDTPAPISGDIEVPGETDRFSFTLTQPKKIVFDSLTANSGLYWSLTNQRGTVVSNRSFVGSDGYNIGGGNMLDLQAGEYVLSVDGAADTTGAYAFRLIDLDNADTFTPGEVVADEMLANRTALYRFDAAAGESFFFDAHASPSETVSWRLLGPDGEYITGPNGWNDQGPYLLARTGSYTLEVEGYVYNNPANTIS